MKHDLCRLTNESFKNWKDQGMWLFVQNFEFKGENDMDDKCINFQSPRIEILDLANLDYLVFWDPCPDPELGIDDQDPTLD